MGAESLIASLTVGVVVYATYLAVRWLWLLLGQA